MRNIIYYVASSIDGFICGPEGSIEGFVQDGSGVNQYLDDLNKFDTAIMGRKTYEFGYKYGLKPGDPPYPHMKNYVFSWSMQLEKLHPDLKICPIDINIVKQLKKEEGTDIYLCGGGALAGWLLENEMIDFLRLKLNPLILGDGVKLFGGTRKHAKTELISRADYDNGLRIIDYKIVY